MAAIFQLRRGSGSVSLLDGELYVNKGPDSLQYSIDDREITLAKLDELNTGSLNLYGDLTASNLYVTGNVKIDGKITVGNETGDTLNIVASLSSSLIPSGSKLFDLGSQTNYYKNLYVETISSSFISGAIAGIGNINDFSASVDLRITNNSSSIYDLSGSTYNLSSSFDTRITNISSSTYNLSSSFDTRITNNSSSIFDLSGSTYNLSSSFNTRITNNSSSIYDLSGSTYNLSSSFDTRITNNSSSIKNLNDYTQSLKTAITVDGVNTTILGNLAVLGTTTTVNSNEVNIGDNILHLNYGFSATEAGIEVTDVTGGSLLSGSLLWSGTNDYWKAGKKGSESKILLAGGDGVLSSSLQLTELNQHTQSLNDFTASVTASLEKIYQTTASLNLFSASVTASLVYINDFTASVTTSLEKIYQTTASLNTSVSNLNLFSGSQLTQNSDLATITGSLISSASTAKTTNDTQDGRLNNLELTSASVNTSVANLNTTTASLNQFTSSTSQSLWLLSSASENHEDRIDYIEGVAFGGIDLNAQFVTLAIVTSSIQSFTSSANTRLNNLESFTSSANTRLNNLESFTSSINTTIKTKLDAEGVVSGSSQVNIYDLENYSTFYDALYVDINDKEEIASATHTLVSGSSQILGGTGIVSGSSQILGGTGIVSGSSQIVPLLPVGVISGSVQILGGTGIVSGSSQITPLLPNGVVSGSAQVITANSITLGTHTTGNYVQSVTGDTTNGLTVAGSGLESADVTLSLAQSIKTDSNPQFNSLGIGTAASTTAGEIRATGDIIAFYSSDIRLKENVFPIRNALQKVNEISGNTYDWKEGFDDVHSHKGTDVGVIAQEIEIILPQIVTNRDNGFKAVQYEKIIPLLIEAIKELSAKVDRLENK